MTDARRPTTSKYWDFPHRWVFLFLALCLSAGGPLIKDAASCGATAY